MFKPSQDQPTTSTTPSPASLLNADGTTAGVAAGASTHQLVLTNLGTLLPSHINAITAFEGRVKNKIVITTKNAPQQDDDGVDGMGSKKGGDDDVHDEIFGKLAATKSKTAGKRPTASIKTVAPTLTKSQHDPFRHKQMSVRERKQRGFGQLPKGGLDYADMTPLIALFQSYLTKLIGIHNTNALQIEETLLRVDLHGAPLSIVKSINPQLVGKFGIVLKESMNNITILTPNNAIHNIMKRGTVFQIDLSFLYPASGHMRQQQGAAATTTTTTTTTTTPAPSPPTTHAFVLIYGDQLLLRPYARLTKKFRVTSTIELKK